MGRIDIVRYLIERNANLENVDIGGETPVFKARLFPCAVIFAS
jgi:hypothetical protein